MSNPLEYPGIPLGVLTKFPTGFVIKLVDQTGAIRLQRADRSFPSRFQLADRSLSSIKSQVSSRSNKRSERHT